LRPWIQEMRGVVLSLVLFVTRFELSSSQDCKFICWNQWSPKITRYEDCTGDNVAPPVALKGVFRQEICPTDDCTSGRIKGDWIASPGSWAWVWPAGLGPPPNPPIECPPSGVNHSVSGSPCVQKCIKPGSYTARVATTVRGGGGGERHEGSCILSFLFLLSMFFLLWRCIDR
jgi:hypothetical protein